MEGTGTVERARARRGAPLRVGVAGLGAVAQAVHLPLLAKHPDRFRIAAVCDLSASTCASLGDRFGVDGAARFGSAEAMLAGADLDALAVLTPGSHGELATAAARRGLAVFCEKPLAYTLAEADELAALEPRFQLGYMKLYDPAVERARELLADRPAPRSIEVTVLHPPDAPQLEHAGLLPRATDVDGAVLAGLGDTDDAVVRRALGDVPREIARVYTDVVLGSIVHDLAIIRFLAGGPLELDHAERWETSVALSGRLPSGTRVSIRWHYLEAYPAYREEVHVHDAGGTVALTFPAPYLLHAPTVLRVVEAGGNGAERICETRSTAEAFERQWLAFAALVHDGVAPRAGISEGREDILASQRATALLAAREGFAVGGEAAAVRKGNDNDGEHGKGGAR
jgi:myo-inositol 2-dehydrogenase / D-chiro-inositol 1-dehydrogenase